jgi:hypothetical protein
LKWRDTSKLWADPEKVPESERWIRYGRDYLEGWRPENKALFDLPKLLVARKVNRGSNYPLGAQFDDTGFCPDKMFFVFCLLLKSINIPWAIKLLTIFPMSGSRSLTKTSVCGYWVSSHQELPIVCL